MPDRNTSRIKRDRIRIALFAYAYEVENDPLVSDEYYDELAQRVDENLECETGHNELDFWFHDCFDSITGMWIHQHPELEKVRNLYGKVKMHFRPS